MDDIINGIDKTLLKHLDSYFHIYHLYTQIIIDAHIHVSKGGTYTNYINNCQLPSAELGSDKILIGSGHWEEVSC